MSGAGAGGRVPVDRRAFLKAAAAGAAAAALPAGAAAAADREAPHPWVAGTGVRTGPQIPELRILVLGGTGFIGIHEVEFARSRGHEVTLFNRGLTNPHLFPDLEKLRGDRDGALEALRGRSWDVVIDNSATVPRRIRETAAVLAGSVGLYVYVSSSGVYYPYRKPGITEAGPLQTLDDPTTEVIDGATFGGLKALCEEEVRAAFPRSLVVRPVLIGGPWDYTHRTVYWPTRLARGGRVLAPGDGSDPFQLVDARDLTAWMVRMAEAGETGTYSCVGPERVTTMRDALEQMAGVAPAGTSLVWADTDFLLERDVGPWADLPNWIPPRDDYVGMCQIDGTKAWAKGLVCRPLLETARATVAWHARPRHRSGPAATPYERQAEPAAGIDAGREGELLAAWDGVAGAG